VRVVPVRIVVVTIGYLYLFVFVWAIHTHPFPNLGTQGYACKETYKSNKDYEPSGAHDAC
jgi:hypothetical protein